MDDCTIQVVSDGVCIRYGARVKDPTTYRCVDKYSNSGRRRIEIVRSSIHFSGWCIGDLREL